MMNVWVAWMTLKSAAPSTAAHSLQCRYHVERGGVFPGHHAHLPHGRTGSPYDEAAVRIFSGSAPGSGDEGAAAEGGPDAAGSEAEEDEETQVMAGIDTGLEAIESYIEQVFDLIRERGEQFLNGFATALTMFPLGPNLPG